MGPREDRIQLRRAWRLGFLWPRGKPFSQAIPPQASATAGHSLFNAILQLPCKADAFMPLLQMKKQKLRDVM